MLGYGFVQPTKYKSEDKKEFFADFAYENKEDLIHNGFELKTIEDEFDIIEALNTLLGTAKEGTEGASAAE